MNFTKYFPSLPEIETKNLLLRQITKSDSDGRDSLEFINDYSVSRFWGMYDEKRDIDKNHRPKKQIRIDFHYNETMKEYKSGNELTWLMQLKDNSKVIGEIVLYDFLLDRQADMGYRLNKNYWGQGYATEAGQAIVNFSFDTLELERLQIRCFKNNPASVRIAQKLGFRQEGLIRNGVILNVMTDYYIFGLLKDEYRA
ncbi:MAG: N-acetyltransferase [Anaerolineaceae bacterium]|nr:MAG: N-acetyltransferase [Anaerolineaceae bacterium]